MPNTACKEELKALRRELNDLRAEYESYKKEAIASRRSQSLSHSADFPIFFQGMIAGELRRRSAFLRIERRTSALEKRLMELEAAQRDQLNSAPH